MLCPLLAVDIPLHPSSGNRAVAPRGLADRTFTLIGLGIVVVGMLLGELFDALLLVPFMPPPFGESIVPPLLPPLMPPCVTPFGVEGLFFGVRFIFAFGALLFVFALGVMLLMIRVVLALGVVVVLLIMVLFVLMLAFFIIRPFSMEVIIPMVSFSKSRASQGLAAIHLSSQLHPQLGLSFGSLMSMYKGVHSPGDDLHS